MGTDEMLLTQFLVGACITNIARIALFGFKGIVSRKFAMLLLVQFES
jgi:hypothetical protein